MVTAVVSLSWMLVVTAVPAHDRPYVDGSRNDSVFTQVFDYNGVARFEHAGAYETSVGPITPFLVVGLESRTFLNASTATIGRSWHRLLSGPLGRDTGWLVPAALLAGFAVVATRRRQPRTDPVRAGCVLWGTWLLLHLAAFSDGAYLNSYYTAALAPAVAALCGIGLSAARRTRRAAVPAVTSPFAAPEVPTFAAPGPAFAPPVAGPVTRPPSGWIGRALLGVAVTGSAAYALTLIPTGAGARPWLVPAVVATAAVVDVGLLVSILRDRSLGGVGSLGLVAVMLALLLVPSVASATVVADGFGPFDTPFEPAAVSTVTGADVRRSQQRAALVAQRVEQLARAWHTPILFITDTSIVASAYILASGREVLPIGGFTGAIPSPTLRQIQLDIAFGQVRLAVVPVHPPGHDPRIVWIRTHCHTVSIDPPAAVQFGVYDCYHAA